MRFKIGMNLFEQGTPIEWLARVVRKFVLQVRRLLASKT